MPNNSESKNSRRELAKQIRSLRSLNSIKRNPHVKIKKVSPYNKSGFVKLNIHGID